MIAPSDNNRKQWNEAIRCDLKERKISKDLAKNRILELYFVENHPTHAITENSRLEENDDEDKLSPARSNIPTGIPI